MSSSSRLSTSSFSLGLSSNATSSNYLNSTKRAVPNSRNLSSSSVTSSNSATSVIAADIAGDESAKDLFSACASNQAAKVQQLLESSPHLILERASVAWPSFENYTPLLVASWHGHHEVVKILLGIPGLDVNVTDHRGYTPLLLSCANGRTEVVKELLRVPSVDVGVLTFHKKSALFLAAAHGRVEILRMLVKHAEVNVNTVDSEGYSPLWKAAYYGKGETIKWLIASGRALDLKLVPGEKTAHANMTATEAARSNGSDVVVDLLERYARDPVKTRQAILGELGLQDLALFARDFSVDFGATNQEAEARLEPGAIQFLNLSLLHIETLSDNLRNYRNVTKLDLSSNALTTLPPCIAELTNLKELFLQDNALPTLPEELYTLPALSTLRVEGNKIETLSTGLLKLSTLQILNLSRNDLNRETAELVVNFFRGNKALAFLSITECGFDGETLTLLIHALLFNFSNEIYSLKALNIDDVTLPSFEGLMMIPVEILRQGSKKVVLFILDLFVSPNADSLFRTKLMVVGFESVGKTTVLDCLFPISDTLSTREGIFNVKKTYHFVLQGRVLKKYADEASFTGGQPPLEELTLENRDWALEESADEKKGQVMLTLVPTSKKGTKPIDLIVESKEQRAAWSERLKRTLFNAATHGIEIQHLRLAPNKQLRQQPVLPSGLAPPAAIDMTVWDFAGQHDYYNNHHYFLSTRTVFLVLWKMSEGESGLRGLEFWLKSLVVHVSRNQGGPRGAASSNNDASGGTHFSVVVAGTFLDHPSVARGEREKRERRVRAIAAECGLEVPIIYYEVSCWTMENIGEVQNAIYTSALTHSYMGEKLPKSYVVVEKALQELRKGRAELPIADTQLVTEGCRKYMRLDLPVVQRALNLLTLWGECVYFDHPEELASTVVLEPKFLTKEVLGQLFNPRLVFFYKNGIIKHSSLVHIWSAFKDRKDFTQVAIKLMALMQRFEVCFQLEEEGQVDDHTSPAEAAAAARAASGKRGKGPAEGGEVPEPGGEALPTTTTTTESGGGDDARGEPAAAAAARFFERCSIIPSLLPVKPGAGQSLESLGEGERKRAELFKALWPKDLPHNQRVQAERVLRFNVVPAELVARLLVRLHPYIQGQMIWRHDVLILKHKTQAWIQVEPSSNRFLVSLRGSNRERCCALMDYIVEEVETVASNYSGVQWTQGIRSPHHSGTLIDLAEVLTDASRDPDHRQLVCPETLLPIKAELLLSAAGLLEADLREKAGPSWWEFEFARAKGDQRENLERLALVENGEIKDRELFEKLTLLLGHFNGSAGSITRAYALDNKSLRSAFESTRQSISQRHKDSQSLFRSEDWRDKDDAELRRRFLLHLSEAASKFRGRDWNDGVKPFVVPVLQGTMEDAAWKIAENGFGTVSTKDLGFFGKGIYFTSDFDYASNYSQPTAEGEHPYLISLVVPGNPYPITEPPFLDKGHHHHHHHKSVENPQGFYGKTCQTGYQSHYTLIAPKHQQGSYPIKRAFNGRTDADELVVFQDAQALPLFLVFISKQKSGDLTFAPEAQPAGFAPARDTRLLLRGEHDLSLQDVLEVVVSEEPDGYGTWAVELVKKRSKGTLVQQHLNGAVTVTELPGEKARVELDLDSVPAGVFKAVQDQLEAASRSHFCCDSWATSGGLLFSLTFEGKLAKAAELSQTLAAIVKGL